MKDDPHETAMTGSRAKPSILTIASIFLAAILGVSLLLAPGTVFCPKHTSYLALPLRPVEHGACISGRPTSHRRPVKMIATPNKVSCRGKFGSAAWQPYWDNRFGVPDGREVDGFLKEMAPHLSHIALIFNPGAAPCARHFLQSVTLGAEATLVPVRNDSEIDAAWKQLQANRTAA